VSLLCLPEIVDVPESECRSRRDLMCNSRGGKRSFLDQTGDAAYTHMWGGFVEVGGSFWRSLPPTPLLWVKHTDRQPRFWGGLLLGKKGFITTVSAPRAELHSRFKRSNVCKGCLCAAL
jgi:hypothetical protein